MGVNSLYRVRRKIMSKIKSNISLGDVLDGEIYEVDEFNEEGVTIIDAVGDPFLLFDGEYEMIEE